MFGSLLAGKTYFIHLGKSIAWRLLSIAEDDIQIPAYIIRICALVELLAEKV